MDLKNMTMDDLKQKFSTIDKKTTVKGLGEQGRLFGTAFSYISPNASEYPSIMD